MRTLSILLVGLALLALCPTDAWTQDRLGSECTWNPRPYTTLPRWWDGPRAPAPDQPLTPFVVDLTPPQSWQAGCTVDLASSPEYGPSDGVLVRFGAGWTSVVAECVAQLTGDPAHDERAYVVVTDATVQAQAETAFVGAGADLSKVVFVSEPTDSIWLRDFGPQFVWRNGAPVIVDSHYYPTRPDDNFLPTLLAEDLFHVPVHQLPLESRGGNLQVGPDRSGFVTTVVEQDNPTLSSSEIAALYQAYQAIDVLHVLPRLPGSVDGTGHLAMWFYLVDEDTVLISEFQPGSNGTAITITENAVLYMQALGFEVLRTPAWNVGFTHYTYTNGFRVNDRIFVPVYGPGNPAYLDEDVAALAAWQAAAGPAVEVVPVDCTTIIPAAGALHSITRQVPRYTAPMPATHVEPLDCGGLVNAGTLHELRWSACDDVAVTAVDVELSVDGGFSFPYAVGLSLENDGRVPWLVPDVLTTDAVLRVSARDGDGMAASAQLLPMEITQAPIHVYDFSENAGVDRWAWGDATGHWATELAGLRHPPEVATELSPADYARLAASDAVGDDSDPLRYVSSTPGSGHESTHVFEFTIQEDLGLVRDLALRWEGYGDQCLQVELYVWDHWLADWSDGLGQTGENHHARHYAGNRDEALVVHLDGDLTRFVDGAGLITFLVYAERPAEETFHDYVAVEVTHATSPWGLWTDDGQALDGAHGPPRLAGLGGLLGDDPFVVRVANAAPLVPAHLVIGGSLLELPFKGGVLVPSVDILVSGLLTSEEGLLELAGSWPAGLPSGLDLYAQVWFADPAGPNGFTASNAVTASTP